MSEELSLSRNERALAAAVRKFIGVRPDFQSAHRSQPETGSIVWQWGDRGPGARLWKTLAYRDLDGATVIVTILRRHGALREIELWRGDNMPVISVARSSEIKEITKAGVIDLSSGLK